MSRKEIEDVLTTTMFDKLLHRGVVAHNADREYIIPVPLMRTWLVEQYAAKK